MSTNTIVPDNGSNAVSVAQPKRERKGKKAKPAKKPAPAKKPRGRAPLARVHPNQ